MTQNKGKRACYFLIFLLKKQYLLPLLPPTQNNVPQYNLQPLSMNKCRHHTSIFQNLNKNILK